MEYFWEIFCAIISIIIGSVFAILFGWIWWGGALIGLGIYLILLIAIKGDCIGEAIEGILDGIFS